MERTFTDAQLLGGLLLVALLAVAGGQARLLRLKRALGLEQLLASSFLFLPLGMLLSETGLGLVNRELVRQFDVLVTLGLGVLGLLLGLRLEPGHLGPREGVLVRGAWTESLFTLALVGAPLFFLLEGVGTLRPGERAAAAALLGCAAAISGGRSLHAAISRADPSPTLSRMADYGTVAVVLAAGLLLAVLGPAQQLGAFERLVAVAFIGAAGGVSAWLLASEAHEPALRTALLMGVLLVTAGTATHLALPPVVVTLLAGATVAWLPGSLARELRESVAFLEGPLTVVLLVIAGAAMRVPSGMALLVLAVFLLLRTAGKILGGRLASQATGGQIPPLMGLGLLPSSAVALGLAIDFHAGTRGPLAEIVVTTAVLGSLLSETVGVWTTRLFVRTHMLRDPPPGALVSTPPGERSSAAPASDPPAPALPPEARP